MEKFETRFTDVLKTIREKGLDIISKMNVSDKDFAQTVQNISNVHNIILQVEYELKEQEKNIAIKEEK